MNENNMDKKDLLEETETELAEQQSEDSGIIFIYDDGPDETDAEEEQQKVFERIQSRPSNTEKYDPAEQTLVQKISNFWYRNKLLVVFGIIGVIVLIYLTIISLPESYDCEASVYVSSSDYPVSITYEVQGEFEKYVDDIDGDGEHKVLVSDFNVAGDNGFIVMTNYVLMQDHLNGKPMNMLWVVDKDLFDMMVSAYGEELFESFEGAPLWIELTTNDVINGSVRIGETPRLGICLRRLTDDFAKDKGLRQSYEEALNVLQNMKQEHPEMFEAAETQKTE